MTTNSPRETVAQIIARAYGGSLFPLLGTTGDFPVDEVDYRAADAVLSIFTTPPARTYAEGVEDAAKAVEALRREVPYEYNRHPCSETKRRAIAAIRLLSQGEKA